MARFISTYGTEEVKKIELNCLRRDGFRCVACRAYDCNSIKDELVELPPGASMTTTQCAYIIPFALGNFYETKGPESKNKDLIWGALHRYFPALRGKIDATSIGQLGNLMTLDASAHAIFCGWDVALWPRDKVCYSFVMPLLLPFCVQGRNQKLTMVDPNRKTPTMLARWMV